MGNCRVEFIFAYRTATEKNHAEKNRDQPFSGFDDREMMYWYIHEKRYTDERNERSLRTKREYEQELLTFIKQLMNHSVEIGLDIDSVTDRSLFKSLESRHLRRWQEWLVNSSPYVNAGKIYSAATIARKTTIIRSFFQYLFRHSYITEDISIGLKKATVRKDDRPDRDMGPTDVVTLLRGFRKIDHPVMFGIILTFTATGIRNEEFCKLDVQHLRRDRIRGGYYFEITGKGNKRRQTPVKDSVIKSINDYRLARGFNTINESDETDPLFPTSRGTRFTPKYLTQYMAKELKKIESELHGIPVAITPHVFRHAFAIISRLNKVDVYDIMRSLGHEKLETTQIYLEKLFEREHHAVNQWRDRMLDEFL